MHQNGDLLPPFFATVDKTLWVFDVGRSEPLAESDEGKKVKNSRRKTHLTYSIMCGGLFDESTSWRAVGH